jgi:hypothetical protein
MFNKRRIRLIALSALSVSMMLVPPARVFSQAPQPSTPESSTAQPASPESSSAQPASPQQFCLPAVKFERDHFSNSSTINNVFLPFMPGTQLFLEGTANPGPGAQPHRVIFTVSDVTKVINGVRTLVIWDRDISDGQLTERELAFFAQDNEGNVWNLGEYPEEFEDGTFAGAPSTWFAGTKGAKAGIHMLATPTVGNGFYLQGFAPNIHFLDCAKVYLTGQSTSVPAGNFNNVLVTQETSPLDQTGGIQLKYHAPGVGIVQIGALNDPEAETLVLVKVKHLGRDAMNKVRERVCELDNRGYKFSDVYRATDPAQVDGHPCSDQEAGDDEARQNIAADANER